MEVKKISNALGAEITGLDICSPTDADFARIQDVFHEHAVLVFRDQSVDAAALVRFSEMWGEIQVNPIFSYVDGYPGVLEINNLGKSGAVTENWHYDSTFAPCPPALTILAPQELPAVGGDTMWSNQYVAYDRLSDRMKAMLDGLQGVFTGARVAKASGSTGDIPMAVHPIVRTHPMTGRKALFVGNPEETLARFDGMTQAESKPILQFLYDHSVQPDNVYRHVWRPNDVAMWDNRCTMHYAVHDYGTDVRRLLRTTINGEAPR